MARESAFTLSELLVALAVAALLALGAVPALSDLIRDQRLIALNNRFNASLQLARSEAVRSGLEVVVCKTAGSPACAESAAWHDGWMVFADADRDRHCGDLDGDGLCDGDAGRVILLEEAPGRGLVIDAGAGNTRKRVVYEPTGFADGYPGTFTFCDARGDPHARGLVLSMTGRLRQADRIADALECP